VFCNFTKEIQLEVVPPIDAKISTSVTICNGESTQLIASGRNAYLWLPKTGLSDNTIEDPYANPTTSTVYTVTVSDYGYCSVTQTVFVKVNPTPTVTAGANTVFNSDEPMYIEAKGTGTLTWTEGDGIICKPCPKTQVMPQSSSCYKILAVNEFGCKATDEVCVEVTNDYNIYIQIFSRQILMALTMCQGSWHWHH